MIRLVQINYKMHQKIDYDNYQIYPPHLRREMFEIDEQYQIIDQLLITGKLPKIEIPDFPLSVALLQELFFGRKSKRIKVFLKKS